MTEAEEMIASIWNEVMANERQRAYEAAQADPECHKISCIFDGAARYRYFESPARPRMREVRFCWSTVRNVAGYFLSWRERDIGDGRWERDQFAARKVRKAAKALASRRHDALEKRRAG